MTLIEQLVAQRDVAGEVYKVLDAAVVAMQKAAAFGTPGFLQPTTVSVPGSVPGSPRPEATTRGGGGPVPNRDEDRTAKIKRYLSSGPKSTKEVSLHLDADRLVTKQALQRLRKAKEITTTGSGKGQKWMLPASSN